MKLLPLFAQNDFKTIEKLVNQEKYDKHEVSEKGSNLFLHAVYYAQLPLMDLFYKQGIDIHQVVKGETSAFSLAAMSLEGIQALYQFTQTHSLSLDFHAEDILAALSHSQQAQIIFEYLVDNFDIQEDMSNAILKYYPTGLGYYFDKKGINPYEFVLKAIEEDKHLSPLMILKEDLMPEQDTFLNTIKDSIHSYDKATFIEIKNAVRAYMSSFREANLHHCYMSNKALSIIMSIMYLDIENPLQGLFAELNDNEAYAYQRKLKSICKKYNLHNISIENAFLKPNLIDYLENSLETVKRFFNLDNHEVGEGVLELNFVAREVSGPQGYFHGPSTSITITENCSTSIFLHEYTHFRQYAGFLGNDKLQGQIHPAMKNLIAHFEGHNSTVEELRDVLHKFASLYLNNLDEFDTVVQHATDFKTEWKYLKKIFEKIINKELNEVYHEHKKAYTKLILSDLKLRMTSFKQGQSLAFTYYQKLNQLKREHIKNNYWTEPVELHARMNEALANQDNYREKNSILNDFLLKTIKPHLEKFNQLLIHNARELKKHNQFVQRNVILKR